MKNEAELSELWPEIRARGTSALRPRLADRVLARVSAARAELTPTATLLLGLGTAACCLAATLVFTSLKVRSSSEKAIAQWEAFGIDDSEPDA